jgi:hypothetical protein
MPISPIPQVQNLNILDPQKMAPAAVAEMKAAAGIGKKYDAYTVNIWNY